MMECGPLGSCFEPLFQIMSSHPMSSFPAQWPVIIYYIYIINKFPTTNVRRLSERGCSAYKFLSLFLILKLSIRCVCV